MSRDDHFLHKPTCKRNLKEGIFKNGNRIIEIMANVYFITVLIFVQASVFIKAAAPFITTHPRSVTTAEGSTVTLSCNASGDPEPTFSWTKNGTTVNTNANPRITLSSQNKQLTITNVRRADSGQYRCVATNINGTTTSNVSTLDVRPGSLTSSTPTSTSTSARPSTSTRTSASLTSSTPTSTSASTTPSTSTSTSAGSTTSSTSTSTSASLTSSTPTSTSASTTPSTSTGTSADSTTSSTSTSTLASTTLSPTTAGPPSSSITRSTLLPGSVVIICVHVKVSTCNANFLQSENQSLFTNVSTNLRNTYRKQVTEYVLATHLTSADCVSSNYVALCVQVTFKLGIFPSGVTIKAALQTAIADGALGDLPVSNAQYNVTFKGVIITDVVKDGQCKQVCCDGAGGPLKFDQQCRADVYKCEGFLGKEKEQDGHCHGDDGDACKKYKCDKDGSGVSSHLPCFSLLILLTTASFFKLTV